MEFYISCLEIYLPYGLKQAVLQAVRRLHPGRGLPITGVQQEEDRPQENPGEAARLLKEKL